MHRGVNTRSGALRERTWPIARRRGPSHHAHETPETSESAPERYRLRADQALITDGHVNRSCLDVPNRADAGKSRSGRSPVRSVATRPLGASNRSGPCRPRVHRTWLSTTTPPSEAARVRSRHAGAILPRLEPSRERGSGNASSTLSSITCLRVRAADCVTSLASSRPCAKRCDEWSDERDHDQVCNHDHGPVVTSNSRGRWWRRRPVGSNDRLGGARRS